MKKYFLIVFCAALLFVVTGCGSTSKVICTKTNTDGDQTMKEEGVFELDSNNKVTKAYGTFIFDDKDTAQSYCDLFKMSVGEKYVDLFECSGKEIKIKDLEKMADDDSDSPKLTGMTKDELIKLEESEGYSCK